jgi:hypothetical protein
LKGVTSGVNAPVRNGTLRIIILAFSVGIKRRRYAQTGRIPTLAWPGRPAAVTARRVEI